MIIGTTKLLKVGEIVRPERGRLKDAQGRETRTHFKVLAEVTQEDWAQYCIEENEPLYREQMRTGIPSGAKFYRISVD